MSVTINFRLMETGPLFITNSKIISYSMITSLKIILFQHDFYLLSIHIQKRVQDCRVGLKHVNFHCTQVFHNRTIHTSKHCLTFIEKCWSHAPSKQRVTVCPKPLCGCFEIPVLYGIEDPVLEIGEWPISLRVVPRVQLRGNIGHIIFRYT